MVKRISSGLVPNNSLWNYVKHSWMPWFDKWFTKQELFGKMSPGIFCNPAWIHLWIYILCIFTSYVLTTFEHLWQMLIRRIFYLMLVARCCLSHFLITWHTPALPNVHCLAKAHSGRNLHNGRLSLKAPIEPPSKGYNAPLQVCPYTSLSHNTDWNIVSY